jgi:rhodanese-related sulfurtransferase
MTVKKKIFIISIVVLVLAVLAIAGRFVCANITNAADNADNGFVVKLPTDAGFYEITVDELKVRIDNESDNNFIIVDIRDDVSYDEAHIPRAINIPLSELGYRLFSLDKTKDIIVYCFVGITSKVACQILVNAGFKDVYNVTGGVKAWDYAIETSDGRINI